MVKIFEKSAKIIPRCTHTIIYKFGQCHNLVIDSAIYRQSNQFGGILNFGFFQDIGTVI